ncbi:glycosyltransferase [Marinovum sp. 2_MG-2023]|uniref:TIGR04282 family arsenosugar biosynthesis glycosyltransferase n=1 Tax=unclassified Marinovum TaxID=2647166 RepID=UPI0026E48089|nr:MULTISPECIES: TIGR04282 family arsenosugar biosynthesis glycosyltransferase [unclassified Marinovum]MDO6730271.1 glycosyltransferase [Marinovum sp. 2_MG-2023]MDO6779009.1 glycosyltransferase [Marinovum sp. 1_MG-2023]
MTRHLILMLKEPRPGRVKTRLGRDIGMTTAAWWFRHQTARLIRRLDDPRWQLVLAVSPDRDGIASRIWPAHLPRVAQGRGSLGDRMARLMRAMPPGPACIIGGDIPGITPPHVARAFASLGRNDAVFGPAPDGGYWLVGLRHPGRAPAGFLKDVRWSGPNALADSRATLPGARIAQIDTLADVDTVDDLQGLGQTVQSVP